MVPHLIERNVDLIAQSRLINAGETPIPDIDHDTSDSDRVGTHSLNPEGLPNGVDARESMLRQILVNHDGKFFSGAIFFIQEPAMAQRDAHDVEIIRGHN